MKDELLIHVTRPRFRISWESPRHLLLSGGFNSLFKDYAPIGHFTVELKSSRKNRFGINHVITGMERRSKEESRQIVIRERLGLGSLNYAFHGALTPADRSYTDLMASKAEDRLRTLIIPLGPEISEKLFLFLEKWIQHGSYTVYGGCKNALYGEGAGCADFAMTFFELATGHQLEDWCVNLQVPQIYVGRKDQPVSLLNLLTASHWDHPGSKLTVKTADTNLAFDWLERKSPHSLGYTYLNDSQKSLPTKQIPDFKFKYPTDQDEQSIWESICIR
jgi:hypothetical protein